MRRYYFLIVCLPPLTLSMYAPLRSPSHCTPPPLTLSMYTLSAHPLNVQPTSAHPYHMSVLLGTSNIHSTHTSPFTPSAFTYPPLPLSLFLSSPSNPPSPSAPPLPPPPSPCTVGENRSPQARLNTAVQTEGDLIHHKVTMATYTV